MQSHTASFAQYHTQLYARTAVAVSFTDCFNILKYIYFQNVGTHKYLRLKSRTISRKT